MPWWAGLWLLGAAACSAPDTVLTFSPVPNTCPRQPASAVRITLLGDFPPISVSGSVVQSAPVQVSAGQARSVSVEGLSATAVTALAWSGPLPAATGAALSVPLLYGAPDSLCPVWGLLQARAFHRATLLAGGQVIATGGVGPTGASDNLEVYDTAEPEGFLARPLYAGAAIGHSATALPDGTLLVAGGAHPGAADANGNGGDAPAQEQAQIYQADGSATGAELFLPGGGRALHAAVLLADGTVWLGGGCGQVQGLRTGQAPACDGANVLASSILYDPTGTSTAGPALSRPRYGHQAVLLGDGRVLVVGGMEVASQGSAPTPALQAEIVDPATPGVAGAAAGRASAGAGRLPGGGLLWVGHEGTDPSQGGVLIPGEVDLDVPPQVPRSGAELTVLPDGAGLLSGGWDSFGHPVGAVELYQGGAFQVLTDATPRAGHAATLLPDGTVLLSGGVLGDGLPTPLVSRFVHSLRLPDVTPPGWPLSAAEGTLWLAPRRPDLLAFDGTTLTVGQGGTGSGPGGRPVALALIAGMTWLGGSLSFDVQVPAGGLGAAVIFGHLSDEDYFYATLVPGQPVGVMAISAGVLAAQGGCQGLRFPAVPAAGSSVALAVSGGQLSLSVNGGVVLTCAAAFPRGALGLGSLGGVVKFSALAVTRGS